MKPATEFVERVRKEAARFPGVKTEVTFDGKHPRVWLIYGNKRQFVVVPSTPSDLGRGLKNKLSLVRRLCRTLTK